MKSSRLATGRSINCRLLFLICLIMASCAREAPPPSPTDVGSQALVSLTVNTLSAEVPRGATRSLTEEENNIQEIMVMVFRDGKYLYMSEGTITSCTAASTSFDVVLQSSVSPVTLFLVANANDAIAAAGISDNDEIAFVKEKLTMPFAATVYPFPMFGDCEATISSSAGNNISGIKMLRSIARADIVVSENITCFELASVQMFRANSLIQIIPDSTTNVSVTSPSVPDDSESNVSTSPFAAPAGNAECQLYMPESSAPETGRRIAEATCIVIGGYYNGSSTATYYRIDFNPGVDGHPFGQILRNHKYTFNITKVEVEGEATPEGAACTESTGIAVVVETWDEQSVEMWYERETYFSVSARTVYLQAQANSTAKIEINTNLSEYSVQWSDEYGNALSGSASSVTSISDEYYTVSLVDGGLQVSTVENNDQDDDRLAYFVIHAGRWDIAITINQYGASRYSDDLIRVLSFSGIGDLGNGYADSYSDADAVGMRMILNVQFSRTGLFKFGGYYFTELLSFPSTAQASTILANYDVIHSPYSRTYTQEQSDIVLKWLNAKSNRVLIISADDSSTNANLLATAGDSLGWNYSNSSSTANFSVVFSDENKEFTSNGLFGSIAAGTVLNVGDGTWGRATIANSAVVPLLETAAGGDMVVGVNKNKRIVYMGEVELFKNRTGGLSGNTGAIQNECDRLMANMWAWITEIVLSGK